MGPEISGSSRAFAVRQNSEGVRETFCAKSRLVGTFVAFIITRNALLGNKIFEKTNIAVTLGWGISSVGVRQRGTYYTFAKFLFLMNFL